VIPAANPASIRAVTDASGLLWIAYLDQNRGRLNVVKQTSSATTVILSQTGTFGSVDLVLDGSGNPHIAYSESGATAGSRVLRYRRYVAPTGWQPVEDGDATLGTISAVNIALAGLSGTEPRIAYVGNGVAKIAWKNDFGWFKNIADNVGEA